jgi:LPS sulfotransferase NodH
VRDPPVVILGVSRSGTTLLKAILDRHPALAIPTESYLVPQLWDRHGERPDANAFVADAARFARVREWGVRPSMIRERLPANPSFAEAVEAIYRSYADLRGKPRFGDKTPAYMQRLDAIDRAFPAAQYVHLIRDGRDAALSFVAMRRRPRFNWARPRRVSGFAAQWRWEVAAARSFGLALGGGRYHELRYEELVADPEPTVHRVCDFLGLDFDPAILEYHRTMEEERLVDHPRLAEPPTPGHGRSRTEMSKRDVARFEAVAGDLLSGLGYPRGARLPAAPARVWGALCRFAIDARIASWNTALRLVRKTALWRVRQIYIRRTSKDSPI